MDQKNKDLISNQSYISQIFKISQNVSNKIYEERISKLDTLIGNFNNFNSEITNLKYELNQIAETVSNHDDVTKLSLNIKDQISKLENNANTIIENVNSFNNRVVNLENSSKQNIIINGILNSLKNIKTQIDLINANLIDFKEFSHNEQSKMMADIIKIKNQYELILNSLELNNETISNFGITIENLKGLQTEIVEKFNNLNGITIISLTNQDIKILSLAKKVDNLLLIDNPKILELESSITELNTQIDSLKSNLSTNITSLSAQINTLESSTNTQISTLESSTNTQISTLESSTNTSITSLNTQINTLESSTNTNITSLNTQINTLESSTNSNITSLSTQINTLESSTNTQIDSINTQLSTLESSTNIAEINTKIDSIESLIHNSVESINTNITNTNTNIDELESTIKTQIETTNTNITNTNTKIEELKSSNANLTTSQINLQSMFLELKSIFDNDPKFNQIDAKILVLNEMIEALKTVDNSNFTNLQRIIGVHNQRISDLETNITKLDSNNISQFLTSLEKLKNNIESIMGGSMKVIPDYNVLTNKTDINSTSIQDLNTFATLILDNKAILTKGLQIFGKTSSDSLSLGGGIPNKQGTFTLDIKGDSRFDGNINGTSIEDLGRSSKLTKIIDVNSGVVSSFSYNGSAPNRVKVMLDGIFEVPLSKTDGYLYSYVDDKINIYPGTDSIGTSFTTQGSTTSPKFGTYHVNIY